MNEKELEALVLEILKMTLIADKQFWPVNMMSIRRPHLVSQPQQAQERIRELERGLKLIRDALAMPQEKG